MENNIIKIITKKGSIIWKELNLFLNKKQKTKKNNDDDPNIV